MHRRKKFFPFLSLFFTFSLAACTTPENTNQTIEIQTSYDTTSIIEEEVDNGILIQDPLPRQSLQDKVLDGQLQFALEKQPGILDAILQIGAETEEPSPDIEGFEETMPQEEEGLPTSYILDVKNIMQNPELPNGCEIVSLTIVLNYLDFDVDKCYMADHYLTKGPLGQVTPWEAYLGNPRNADAYGCYSPVITKDANTFLSDMDSELVAYDLSGTPFEDLFEEIVNGNPIIIWATADMEKPRLSTTWNINGEDFTWKSPEHCLVMYGYNTENNLVYVADPLVGNTIYNLHVFKNRYKQMYSQAVVIK